MSQTGFDYPDWNRVDQWVGAPFVNENNVNHGPAGVLWGPFPMGPWEAVVLSIVTASISGLLCNINWWQDKAMTQLVGRQVCSSTSQRFFEGCFPALGPWVSLDVSYAFADGPQNTTTILQPRKGVHGWARNIADGLVMERNAFPIAALSTVVTLPYFAASGRAHFFAECTAVNWVCNLYARRGDSTDRVIVAQLYRAALGTLATATVNTQKNAMIVLPPMVVAAEMQNQDAAAATFWLSLIMDSDW